jgi:heme exporter protein CcmD
VERDAMMQFLGMGGYAAYVWPSVLLTVAVMLLNIYWARRLTRRAMEAARRRIAMQRSKP